MRSGLIWEPMSSRRVVDLRGRESAKRPARAPRTPRTDTYERPRSALRVHRRKLKFLGILIVIACVAGLVWGVGRVSYLPRFSIEHVVVRGNHDLSASIVQYFVETRIYDGTNPFLSRSNIFLYPRERIQEELRSAYPRIKDVRVWRQSFMSREVLVDIVERDSYARWCAEACYVLDSSGYVFAPIPTTDSSSTPGTSFAEPYVFSGGIASSSDPVGQSYLPGRFGPLVAFLARLGQSGYIPTAVRQEGSQDFSVTLESGFSVRAAFGQNPDTLVRNLDLLFGTDPLRGNESSLEYIDLRFGDRVFYKMKDGIRTGVSS